MTAAVEIPQEASVASAGATVSVCYAFGTKAADVSKVYDQDDWRALSRRLALKLPNRPAVHFSRWLLIVWALLLLAGGVLNWLAYWG